MAVQTDTPQERALRVRFRTVCVMLYLCVQQEAASIDAQRVTGMVQSITGTCATLGLWDHRMTLDLQRMAATHLRFPAHAEKTVILATLARTIDEL